HEARVQRADHDHIRNRERVDYRSADQHNAVLVDGDQAPDVLEARGGLHLERMRTGQPGDLHPFDGEPASVVRAVLEFPAREPLHLARDPIPVVKREDVGLGREGSGRPGGGRESEEKGRKSFPGWTVSHGGPPYEKGRKISTSVSIPTTSVRRVSGSMRAGATEALTPSA